MNNKYLQLEWNTLVVGDMPSVLITSKATSLSPSAIVSPFTYSLHNIVWRKDSSKVLKFESFKWCQDISFSSNLYTQLNAQAETVLGGGLS